MLRGKHEKGKKRSEMRNGDDEKEKKEGRKGGE